MSGILYVVGTPIGNLGDFTDRAKKIFAEVDLIACEDTRVTIKLLNWLNIKKPLISYHQHSGQSKKEQLLEELHNGKNLALVSDAGMPGISDPGTDLINAAQEAKIKVEIVPGPTAFVAALSLSGFNTQEFLFVGFLPHKKGRATKIKALVEEEKTVVFYESPYRVKRLLGELQSEGGERRVFVARELTKKFEETYRGSIAEVLPPIKEKGEFVVILEGKR